jgi:hypothetical protein
MRKQAHFTCAWCGALSWTAQGAFTRDRKISAPLYCDRECAGMGRRKDKTAAQLKEEKRLYDVAYRAKNAALLKKKKRRYHLATYDPEKAAVVRKLNMPRHVDYCRRPEYRAWKKEYDQNLRAAEYGPFAEAYRFALILAREIRVRETATQVRIENDTINKAQERRRSGHPSIGSKP